MQQASLDLDIKIDEVKAYCKMYAALKRPLIQTLGFIPHIR
jgi:hypothetical protein